MKKRKICVVITDKAQLSRLLTLLAAIKKSSRLELQLVVGGGALTYRYGNIVKELEKNGFRPDYQIPTAIEGAGYLGMAKTAALGMLEFATAFEQLGCEMVVIRGDRFEMLPLAAAAAYLNKVVVHIEGGEKTGSIDESVRHAITKLAHVHFATNEEARRRIIAMGEESRYVFNVGSLDVDYLTKMKWWKRLPNGVVNSHGTGAELDLQNKFIVVMFNPVTSEVEQARDQVENLLTAIDNMELPTVWIWPNLDAGTEEIAKRIREWQIENEGRHKIRFIRYLVPREFINLIRHAAVVVGNSSTGIKECAWLGVPAVNIGTRQRGRKKAKNVIDTSYHRQAIRRAITAQIKHGSYARSKLYGDGSTGQTIAEILARMVVPKQKNIWY